MTKNMTRGQYEQLLNKLRSALHHYDSKYYNSKKFNLYLANGDKVNYSIPENVIAHILGVNTNYLASTSVLTTDSLSSIDMLRGLCNEENWYGLISKMQSGIINLEELFSAHIDKKIEIFADNIKPVIYNMEFICKIDRKKIHNQGIDYMDIDYLICSKDSQERFLVLGIVENNGSYVARTSQVFETEEDLKKEFKDKLINQELTFASKLQITNIDELDYRYQPIVMTPDIKKEKVKTLVHFKNLFSASVNITYDYNFVISQSNNQFTISKKIVEYMKQGKIIDLDELSMNFSIIPEPLRIIVEQYNDSLCAGANEYGNLKYSEVSNENNSLKSKNNLLKLENEKLKSDKGSLTEQVNILQEENSNLTACFEEIQKTLTKVKK